MVHPDALMVEQRAAIARFSLERRVPVISGWAAIAEGGGLMTYGPESAGVLPAARLLRRPHLARRQARGLPIELPSTVELVVNLKTAKALGLTVPAAVLLRADRVIV